MTKAIYTKIRKYYKLSGVDLIYNHIVLLFIIVIIASGVSENFILSVTNLFYLSFEFIKYFFLPIIDININVSLVCYSILLSELRINKLDVNSTVQTRYNFCTIE